MYRGCWRVFAGLLSSVKTDVQITLLNATLRRCSKEEENNNKNKRKERMQEWNLSREEEKGSTPKCNIPRRQTISSESKMKFTCVEIRNALKNLISTWCLFFMARSRYIKSEKREVTLFESSHFRGGRENAVNVSRYFYTNLYLTISGRIMFFLAIDGEKESSDFCSFLV